MEAVMKEVSSPSLSRPFLLGLSSWADDRSRLLCFVQDYLKIMAETFENAEDLEVITDLHTLFTMMQTIREFEMSSSNEGGRDDHTS